MNRTLLLASAAAAAAAMALPRPRLLPQGPPVPAATWRLTGALLTAGRRLGHLAGLVPTPPFQAGERLVERAGRPAGLAAEDLRPLRAGSLLVFALLGAAAWMVAGGVVGPVAAIGLAGFGWTYPDLWLRSAAARRRELIERRAPLLLDMLAATVAAGVGIDHALEAAAGSVDGPLREELELTLANLALGRRRGEELRDLAERSGSPSLGRLGAALRMSDRLGVPLAGVLRRQAGRARAERARDVQERAAKAGPKMLMVVVFVLVPASLLPLLTAVALTALGSLGELGF